MNEHIPALSTKPRVVSGVQPSADSLHLGNYVGALRNWVAMQDENDCVFFVADLHSITAGQDPATMNERTRVTAAQYIAAGIDPERSILLIQSQVPEHTQLAWALNCITGYGEAARMTQFKDKSQKQGAENTTVGLFSYPVLMAADILIYQANQVPVGEDQRQHLELTRNLAQRFNTRFGETFVVPDAKILENSAKVYDLQDPTAKMSKSAASENGLVRLLDPGRKNAKKIKSAVTDDRNVIRFDREDQPGIANLLSIYSSLTDKPIDAIVDEYRGKLYGHLKVDLAEVVEQTLNPIQRRAQQLLDDPAELDRLLARGAQKAREITAPTLRCAYDRLGFLPGAPALG